MKNYFTPNLLLTSLAALFFVMLGSIGSKCPAQAESQSYGCYKLSGRVTDSANNPIKGVRVEVWEKKDNGYISATSTNSKGEFSFAHDPCGPLFLEVTAPIKTQLASAIVENIPGTEARNILISMKHGYLVEGRVTSRDGKPVKGILLKAFATGHAFKSSERVHGGGAVETTKNGYYKMVLTPGEKTFVLLNKNLSEYASYSSHTATITHDQMVVDFQIPYVGELTK